MNQLLARWNALPSAEAAAAIAVAERAGLDDRALFRAYRAMIGLYTFRGWRAGLRLELTAEPAQDVNADQP